MSSAQKPSSQKVLLDCTVLEAAEPGVHKLSSEDGDILYPGTLADDTWLTHGPGSQMLTGLLDWLNNVPQHPKDAHILIPGTY